jgi:hypothetical protein
LTQQSPILPKNEDGSIIMKPGGKKDVKPVSPASGVENDANPSSKTSEPK